MCRRPPSFLLCRHLCPHIPHMHHLNTTTAPPESPRPGHLPRRPRPPPLPMPITINPHHTPSIVIRPHPYPYHTPSPHPAEACRSMAINHRPAFNPPYRGHETRYTRSAAARTTHMARTSNGPPSVPPSRSGGCCRTRSATVCSQRMPARSRCTPATATSWRSSGTMACYRRAGHGGGAGLPWNGGIAMARGGVGEVMRCFLSMEGKCLKRLTTFMTCTR